MIPRVIWLWLPSVLLLSQVPDIVMTGGSEEDRNGRVSIRDDPDNLIFTVTLESLTMEDAGTYMCAVDIPLIDHSFGIDKFFKVELFMVPGLRPGSSTKIPEPTRSSPADPQPSMTTNDTIPAPSPQPRSLLSSPYFCILVFLELPLFLCMLSAVLWVNRPQRCSGRQGIQPYHENQ
ncbi:CMRF-35-like molecule 4 isoform X2 [Rattus norvegicus]|uniref:uncharacterized protein LOC501742 precursor n=1 Tax=Rattus norvegicus TaxID=10116 RepID=UPI0003D0EDAA|nr:CMRF-35-like molecule 4 isoform X2 [Rattus norvegicus]